MPNPIFFDPTMKRVSRAKRMIFFIVTLFIFAIFVFGLSLFLHPILPLPQVLRDITTQHGLHRSLVPPIISKQPIYRRTALLNGTGNSSPENRNVYMF